MKHSDSAKESVMVPEMVGVLISKSSIEICKVLPPMLTWNVCEVRGVTHALHGWYTSVTWALRGCYKG